MILLARRRGLSPVWRPLSRYTVYLSLLSVLWIGGRASAQTPSAQPATPSQPQTPTQPPTATGAPTQPPSTTQPPPTEAPAQEPQEQEEPASSGSTVVDAARALREGRYDRVEQIAARAGAAGSSPALDALRGRALAARGRYDEAIKILTAASAANPGREATLELALQQQKLGRVADARASFTQVARTFTPDGRAMDLVRVARAFRALGDSRQSSALYQRAANLAAKDPEAVPVVQTGWGELFLEKYNTQDAVEAFRTALKADPKAVDAYLGIARALMDEAPDRAGEAARQVLAINKFSVDARLILAELALDERKVDAAREEIERAQDVNPISLEAFALQAAIAHLQGRKADFDAVVAKALAINPRYGDIYRVPGANSASHYRFEEAVALVNKAIELEPESARAQGDLGLHLLRTGDEASARAALEKAFKLDGYDVVTYNLLEMLDGLDKFETIKDGDLIVRLHPDEVRVMKEPLLRIARESLAAMSKQYGFTPTGPILIEAFPKHDDFAVRTLGLPGMMGALGVCFGKVVTLDSPRARPPGQFNWSATLWHELAHVITLQMSNQRVPRWLTEGISVFEERRARPEWGRDGEFEFLNAMAKGELIKVAELNSGFMSMRTINLAYHQSSVVVEHLVDQFGDQALGKMLKAYGEGLDTEAVVRRTLDTDLDGLQRSFDQYIERKFGKIRAALKPVEGDKPAGDADVAAVKAYADRYDQNYPAQLRAGRVLFEKGDLDGAQAVLERAVTLVPQTMGDESARTGLAEIAVKRGDTERAIKELTMLLADSQTGLEAARKLATLAREAKDEPAERKAIERMVALDPFDATVYAGLGRLALTQKDAPAATRALQLALDLGPQDPAAVHTDLAEAYMMAGDTVQVRQHAILALEIAPRFERAQELLLKVVDARRP
jgi:tetratricopeptide (TPR) repeat protein